MCAGACTSERVLVCMVCVCVGEGGYCQCFALTVLAVRRGIRAFGSRAPTKPTLRLLPPPSLLLSCQVDVATVANVAFHDPLWAQRSELLKAVVTCTADAANTTKAGATQYLSTLDPKDRQWVQLLAPLAPLTPFPHKPGYVSPGSPLRGVLRRGCVCHARSVMLG